MTDYHTFLVREVSELHRNAGESRREVYERAREALLANLHRPTLRIAESEVSGELRAFDAAVRRDLRPELARGLAVETGLPASTDSTGPNPIIGIEVKSLEITQTEVEAGQINGIGEAKSAPLAKNTNADSDLHGQMLQAIGIALDRAVHPQRSTDAIGKEHTQLQPLDANFHGVAEARTLRTRLRNMVLAIFIFCVVFAVIYLMVDMGNWFGVSNCVPWRRPRPDHRRSRSPSRSTRYKRRSNTNPHND